MFMWSLEGILFRLWWCQWLKCLILILMPEQVIDYQSRLDRDFTTRSYISQTRYQGLRLWGDCLWMLIFRTERERAFKKNKNLKILGRNVSENLRARLRRESLITGSIQRTGQSCIIKIFLIQKYSWYKNYHCCPFLKLKESFSNDQLLLKVQLLWREQIRGQLPLQHQQVFFLS